MLTFSRQYTHSTPHPSIYHSIGMHNFILRGTYPTNDHARVMGMSEGKGGRGMREGILNIFSYRIALAKI